MHSDPAQLFAEHRWDEIASRIDTGTTNPDSSRALIVFNTTSEPLSGIAVFHVDMPWRDGRELQGIQVSHLLSQRVCISSISEPIFSGGRIMFDLCFEVVDIPALGWDTYIAEYVETATNKLSTLHPNTVDLVVHETPRHTGSLSPKYP